VIYISNYRPLKEDQASQIKEQHVTNKLSKFQLNLTFNEPINLILQKLCRLEKHTRPTTSPLPNAETPFRPTTQIAQ